jgi:hypothetical protein
MMPLYWAIFGNAVKPASIESVSFLYMFVAWRPLAAGERTKIPLKLLFYIDFYFKARILLGI